MRIKLQNKAHKAYCTVQLMFQKTMKDCTTNTEKKYDVDIVNIHNDKVRKAGVGRYDCSHKNTYEYEYMHVNVWENF
jgi:hypothetical protein